MAVLDSRSVRRLLGKDQVSDLVEVVALFATYAVLDRVLRSASKLTYDDPAELVLFVRAAAGNPIAWVVLGAVLIAGVVLRPGRLWAPWDTVENGTVVRWIAVPAVVLLTWSYGLYHYNFLADQWHVADRLLLVVFAGAAMYRPIFLVPFALQVRVIAWQFTLPFGTEAGPNIDAILTSALVVIAALYALHVMTGTRRSAPVLLALATVLVSHFFTPGRGKLPLGWFSSDHVWNFPLSAYTAGWLGHTSGAWARRMSDLAETFSAPLRVGTLVCELGSVIAVVHYRLLRWWLPIAIAFHVTIFAFTGFWFLAWVSFEVALLVVVSLPRLRPWVAQNATPARGVLAAAVVVLASGPLFHPPRLSWLDGPVSYGYELEGTGLSGASYHVPISAVAPFEQELSFLRVHLAPTQEASAAYGAVATRAEYDALNTIGTWEGLEQYERGLGTPPIGAGSPSEQFMVQMLDHLNRDGADPWFVRPPPTHFWSSRPAPVYRYQEPLVRLDVVRVTALHLDDGQTFRRESVLTVEAQPSGEAQVTARSEP
jgi:hypothetical protein